MSEPTPPRVYDLEERTAKFGGSVIDFVKRIPLGPVTNRLIDQVVGSGTSVGANYCEADDAVSKKDFRHRISICKKEARETKFYVRMIVRAVPELRESAKPVWQEAKELHLIFAKIYRSGFAKCFGGHSCLYQSGIVYQLVVRVSSFLRHWVFRHSSFPK